MIPTFEYIVPEVFKTGVLNHDATPKGKLLACADGLSGWAYCMAGNDPPEKFGEGMAAIGHLLGVTPLPENLSRYADEHLNEVTD